MAESRNAGMPRTVLRPALKTSRSPARSPKSAAQ